MRKIFVLAFFAVLVIFSSCGRGGAGELVGAFSKKFKSRTVPLGMVFIPAGRNAIGATDEDITFYRGKLSRMVSFTAFFMDETEITNAEYRQFVNWVRDSVTVTRVVTDFNNTKYYQQPKNKGVEGAPPATFRNIKWQNVQDGKLWRDKDPKIQNDIKQKVFISNNDAVYAVIRNDNYLNNINTGDFRYAYAIKNIDYQVQAKPGDKLKKEDFYDIYSDAYLNVPKDKLKRNQHPSVAVYPDTLVWRKDFAYEYNDPMIESYFNHPSYDDYPVVGVTWDQANAFCAWRSQLYETVAKQRNMPSNTRLNYSLPTEAEFEYAARGGKTQTKYPWGGPYIRNAKGCLQANFKVGRGNYADDGALYTVKAKSYFPNDYGLYNMAGNVAEWTLDGFNRRNYEDKNPIYRDGKRKTVRGGSWKDIGFFLQNAVATYEYQDVARSYIGFRCVSKYPGNDFYK